MIKSHSSGNKLKASQNIDNWYYGDIYAKTDVQVLFIKYSDFEQLPLVEIERILDSSKHNIDVDMRRKSIVYTVSRRYGVDMNEF